MSENVTISVDALGADRGLEVTLPGVEAALAADPALTVLLCGPGEAVVPFAESHERVQAVPTTQEVEMGEHPANAVRRKKDSSLVVGARLVRDGLAQGFFSAGSTGAVLAAGTLVIGRVKGCKRPALATVVPSPVKPVVLCDVGANADCKPEYLVQFAQMASAYARLVLGVEEPRVGLLNIGEEETKGSQLAQQAHALLRGQVPGFAGNAEGRDVLAGAFDVIVCDGFTGNVCLKTIEGTAGSLVGALKGYLKASPVTMAGAALAKPAFRQLKGLLDPAKQGGAPLLGVRGACLTGHGSSNAEAIGNGVLLAARIARSGVSEIIAQTMAAPADEQDGGVK